MILIIGGVASGKRTFARSLGFTEKDFADAVLDDRPAVYNVERLVAQLGPDADVCALVEALAAKGIVICDEVGSGVVPAEKGARLFRENVGRLCEGLSGRADAVVRCVCGIPMWLKGSPDQVGLS